MMYIRRSLRSGRTVNSPLSTTYVMYMHVLVAIRFEPRHGLTPQFMADKMPELMSRVIERKCDVSMHCKQQYVKVNCTSSMNNIRS